MYFNFKPNSADKMGGSGSKDIKKLIFPSLYLEHHIKNSYGLTQDVIHMIESTATIGHEMSVSLPMNTITDVCVCESNSVWLTAVDYGEYRGIYKGCYIDFIVSPLLRLLNRNSIIAINYTFETTFEKTTRQELFSFNENSFTEDDNILNDKICKLMKHAFHKKNFFIEIDRLIQYTDSKLIGIPLVTFTRPTFKDPVHVYVWKIRE